MKRRLVEKVTMIETLRHGAKVLTDVSQWRRGPKKTRIR